MKIEELHRQQQESLARREELLQDIEQANQLTQRERVETQRQKEAQAEELAAQVGTTLRPNSGLHKLEKSCIKESLLLYRCLPGGSSKRWES